MLEPYSIFLLGVTLLAILVSVITRIIYGNPVRQAPLHLSDLPELVELLDPALHYFNSVELPEYFGFELKKCERYYQVAFRDGLYWLQQFEPTQYPLTLRVVIPVIPEVWPPEMVVHFQEAAERHGLDTKQEKIGGYIANIVALGSESKQAGELAVALLKEICEIEMDPRLHQIQGINLSYLETR